MIDLLIYSGLFFGIAVFIVWSFTSMLKVVNVVGYIYDFIQGFKLPKFHIKPASNQAKVFYSYTDKELKTQETEYVYMPHMNPKVSEDDISRSDCPKVDYTQMYQEMLERELRNTPLYRAISSNSKDNLMKLTFKDRMEILNVNDCAELCRDNPEFVTEKEIAQLLELGLIDSIEDISCGAYVPDLEKRLYQTSLYWRNRNKGNAHITPLGESAFSEDELWERISDIEDKEMYGSDFGMDGYNGSDTYDDVFDEYDNENDG